VFYAVLKKLTS